MSPAIRQVLATCPRCGTVVREVEMELGRLDRYFPCGHDGPLAAIEAQPMMELLAFDVCRPRDSYHTSPHARCVLR